MLPFVSLCFSLSLSLSSHTLCGVLSQVHEKACASFELAPVANFVLKSGRNVVSLADSVRLSKYPNRATLDLTEAKAPLGLSADGTSHGLNMDDERPSCGQRAPVCNTSSVMVSSFTPSLTLLVLFFFGGFH